MIDKPKYIPDIEERIKTKNIDARPIVKFEASKKNDDSESSSSENNSEEEKVGNS